MRYTDIYFRDIVATNAGSAGDGKDGMAGKGAIVFDCDTTFDKSGGNCVVELDNVALPDFAKHPTKMECQGTYGVAKHILGIQSCLTKPAAKLRVV